MTSDGSGGQGLGPVPIPPAITPEQWCQYSQDGYLPLGRVLTDEQVDLLRTRADDLAMGRVTNPGVLLQRDLAGDYDHLADIEAHFEQPTISYRKIQGLEHDDMFFDLVEHPAFLAICRHEYGSHAPLSLFRAMVMNKPAGGGTPLPWHQDSGRVWQLDRDPLVTVWVALDDADTDNGCVEVIPGSHLTGLVTVEGSTLSEEDAAVHCPDDRIVPMVVPAGHAVLLHNWVMHRSGINTSGRPRRAFTACVMDGRTVGTLTGSRYPAVFAAYQPSADEYDFLTTFYAERDHLRATAEEAVAYARSLEAECERLRAALAAAGGPLDQTPTEASSGSVGGRLRRLLAGRRT